MEAYIKHQTSGYEFSRVCLTLSQQETLISEHTAIGRRPVHGLGYSVGNLNNNILTQMKQVGVLLENSTGSRGEGIKELPYKSSQIIGFGKGLSVSDP